MTSRDSNFFLHPKVSGLPAQHGPQVLSKSQSTWTEVRGHPVPLLGGESQSTCIGLAGSTCARCTQTAWKIAEFSPSTVRDYRFSFRWQLEKTSTGLRVKCSRSVLRYRSWVGWLPAPPAQPWEKCSSSRTGRATEFKKLGRAPADLSEDFFLCSSLHIIHQI